MASTWTNGTLRRPALSISYNSTAGAKAPPVSYPRNVTAVPRTWWVGPAGSDDANSGHQALPFRSIAKALVEAWPGDRIYLLSGTYAGAEGGGIWCMVTMVIGGFFLSFCFGRMASI
ncbi:hypothetical protein TSOC_012695, partial [Tetrabaena socialis]